MRRWWIVAISCLFMSLTMTGCPEEGAEGEAAAEGAEGAEGEKAEGEAAEGAEGEAPAEGEKAEGEAPAEGEKAEGDEEQKAEGEAAEGAEPAPEAAEAAGPKPTEEECKKACAHATGLSMAAMPDNATDDMKAAIEKVLSEGCPDSCVKLGTKAQVECYLAAKTAMDLAACPK